MSILISLLLSYAVDSMHTRCADYTENRGSAENGPDFFVHYFSRAVLDRHRNLQYDICVLCLHGTTISCVREETVMTQKMIRKRDGRLVEFHTEKIRNAIWRSFLGVGQTGMEDVSDALARKVETMLELEGCEPEVEHVQDLVEQVLMQAVSYTHLTLPTICSV